MKIQNKNSKFQWIVPIVLFIFNFAFDQLRSTVTGRFMDLVFGI